MTAEDVIREFWGAMGSNDFALAAERLSPDFEYFMPQSGEFFQGRAAFAAINTAYPAEGPWRFVVRRVVANGAEGVSDVVVTDGAITARAVTFHWVADGLITRQVEYWPDPYEAPAWRSEWVTVLGDDPF